MKLYVYSLIWVILGHYNDTVCGDSLPVTEPLLLTGVGLTDSDILLRFFKPLPENYYYRLAYWRHDKYGSVQSFYFYTPFGPLETHTQRGLAPGGDYRFKIYMICTDNITIKGHPVKLSAKTLPKCKFFLGTHEERFLTYFYNLDTTPKTTTTSTMLPFTSKGLHTMNSELLLFYENQLNNLTVYRISALSMEVSLTSLFAMQALIQLML